MVARGLARSYTAVIREKGNRGRLSTRVRLFRDAGEPSSIGIVADALVERLRHNDRLSLSESACKPPLRGGAMGKLSRRTARFGVYPLTAMRARSQADVFHVLS